MIKAGRLHFKNMFCPNCGANNATEQRFCRSCGFNLEQTAVSLLEQLPGAETGNLIKKQIALEKFGSIVFGGFGIVVALAVIGMIYWIVVKMVLTGASPVAGILLAAFLIFAALTLSYVVMNESLKEKKAKLSPGLINELEKGENTGKLLEEGNFQPAVSVTENTTEFLYTKNKTRKLE